LNRLYIGLNKGLFFEIRTKNYNYGLDGEQFHRQFRHAGYMKNGIFGTVTAIAAASLAGCTINITVPPAIGQAMMGSEVSSSFNEVEMFADMMIPHHQQAIDMSNLALEKESSSPDLKDLAQRIIDGQTPEITLMEGWRDDSDERGMMGMMSSGGEMMMGGMASDDELQNLATLEGSEFDTEFLTLMITHHEGALHMVHMIDDSSFEEAAQLAKDIVRVQTAEIEEMKAMLQGGSGA
jgi:uncharacterized protein (DUF305 family)